MGRLRNSICRQFSNIFLLFGRHCFRTFFETASKSKFRPALRAAKTEASFFAGRLRADSHNGPMSSQASGLRVASVVFALFALGHLLRLVNHARVMVGTHQMPMWGSVVALIIAGVLSIWMWRLSTPPKL